ncbi:MAG: UDP-N-acetylmuramoyl-L-alanine--D-glutamate ligase [Hydrogenophilales bacterium CG_4_9_14_3_um_filter_59_35]|nr:MAG: UDP-N-acetylmuramoyl-L-alanine--D-glutamate ligase [Hydrogenophilales bacterium CG18_big_fil_WC_8_21_14_2_50_58_12]PIY01891.1 MAG: UDP-N-acetylmuramoyl-L-alanine--D-glutamate ligase [Hydrogenophilales bacterium CG_4_10_14_3_um_filter_58_23]PJB07387.1 MAG: UDP-N-acetylmuramoyl-L-alanine--D-glutamate ligase [Hydrogenophilales bacterium CG_4_9_14_3_um_filter_59_35]
MKSNLEHKKVLVVGLGDTGLSMARWLDARGAVVAVADSRDHPPHAARLQAELPGVPLFTGKLKEEVFCNADLLAVSPGVSLREPAVADALAHGVEVVGDIELFAQALRTQDLTLRTRVIAITGANGKSTVTEMVGAMCKKAGLHTVVAGNIGLPVLNALSDLSRRGETADVFVIELSSFQLETTHTLNPAVATVLNVTEDHMDRYHGMAEYAAAKARIFAGNGVQVLNREDSYSLAMAKPDSKAVTFGLDAPQKPEDWGLLGGENGPWLAQGENRLLAVADLPLAGLHNAANALAALALCRAIDLPLQPLIEALREFKGLPHRVEKVAEINGITFYDDSKGTNVGATVAALNGMPCKVVLIAGGDGKGQDFSPLAPAVSAHARAVVLIGRDGPKIGAALTDCGVPLFAAASMEEAVILGFEQTRSDDAVLLSPACASFDMFRSYEHRAQVFIASVKKLGKAKV